MVTVRDDTAPKRIEVFHRRGTAWLLAGTCTLPGVQADVIEVLHPTGRQGLPYDEQPVPEAHRFSILRTFDAEGERLVLITQDGARPEVLPAWRPALRR